MRRPPVVLLQSFDCKREKRIRKISTENLRQLAILLPALEAMTRELNAKLRNEPEARQAIDEQGVWWALLYELRFVRHLSVFLKSFGIDRELSKLAEAADPQAAALDLAMSIERSLESLISVFTICGIPGRHSIGSQALPPMN